MNLLAVIQGFPEIHLIDIIDILLVAYLFYEIYKLVKFLPKEEKFALSDQMRRAAVSVPSNIAEGYERNSDKEFINFLVIARGSRAELETQLYICVRQGYITQQQAEKPFLFVTKYKGL